MSQKGSRSITALVAIPIVIALCWVVPRLIVGWIGLDGHWAPYLYQYLLGGLIFVIGLWVIRRSGACDFDRPGDRRWFGYLVFGYFSYAALHGVVFWLAEAVPFKGP